MDRTNPADTLRNNDVVITSKRRHFDVITPKWLCFDVITTFKGKWRIRLYPEVHGIFVTSNERYGVSNQLQVFFSRFRLATKIHNYHWPFVRRIQRWQVDPPLKGSEMWKAFPCPDVIMASRRPFEQGQVPSPTRIKHFIDWYFAIQNSNIAIILRTAFRESMFRILTSARYRALLVWNKIYGNVFEMWKINLSI